MDWAAGTPRTAVRRLTAGVVVALVVGACGGGGGGEDAGPAAATRGPAAATLQVRDEAAQRRPEATSTFARAADGEELSIGDTVRTNGTGFVQVDYRDGSLTRLDSNAELTLTALSATGDAQRIAGRLEGGRAWSNVRELTSSEGSYELETPVATAAVRGTLFDTDCTDEAGSCTFVVAEGIVVVTPRGGEPIELRGGDSVTVRPDGSTSRNALQTLDRLRQDPWIARNLGLDDDETDRRPAGLPEEAPDEEGAAALDGRWNVRRTVTRSTNPLQPVGSVTEVVYTFTSECAPSGCTLHLDAGAAFGASQRADLIFADAAFSGPVTGESPCRDDAGRQLSVSPLTGTITLRPDAGDPARFTGVLDLVLGASAGCGERALTFELAGQRGSP